MFVVALTYHVDLREVEALLHEHRAWLDRWYRSGVFVASGRRRSAGGSVILAKGVSREELDALLAKDPVHEHGLATYDVVEFDPERVAGGLEALQV